MAETEDEVDALHPRLSTQLIGQESAEQRLLKTYLSGKMHHAWILGGARGIGKATLAYKFATFVLRYPDPAAFDDRPANLDVDPDDPVARRIVSQGHADLLAITPAWDHRNKRYKTEIGATEARQASNFFARTAGEGGWRVCIVDPAGSMNVTAANALLKILEEPPSRALFLLVADTPGRLLQTIRSRCLRLDLKPLDDSNVSDVLRTLVARDAGLDLSGASSIVPYAGGSPGRAADSQRRRVQDFRNLPRHCRKTSNIGPENVAAFGSTACRPQCRTGVSSVLRLAVVLAYATCRECCARQYTATVCPEPCELGQCVR